MLPTGMRGVCTFLWTVGGGGGAATGTGPRMRTSASGLTLLTGTAEGASQSSSLNIAIFLGTPWGAIRLPASKGRGINLTTLAASGGGVGAWVEEAAGPATSS